MKKLVDSLVDGRLEAERNAQALQALSSVIQVDGDKIFLGTKKSYLEIGGEGEITFVSNGRKIDFTQLLQVIDLVESLTPESTDGIDGEFEDDPDEGLIPLPDDEGVLTG